jgi:hypothetical protein
MQQEDYKDTVQREFDARWASVGLEKKEALSFRCKIAQELLDAEERNSCTFISMFPAVAAGYI